uniref:Uncharacterized protein n=1 Tax=Meloidogyne enterolobii TaxID=390850 RepID=A0A6V7VFQ7_MELEN|nr:unnamed protein product [Meloidogyne enterolobii]
MPFNYFKLIYLTIFFYFCLIYFDNVFAIKQNLKTIGKRFKTQNDIEKVKNEHCWEKKLNLNIEQIFDCLYLLINICSWEIPETIVINLEEELNNELLNILPKKLIVDENEINIGGLLAKELWKAKDLKEFLNDKTKEFLIEIKSKIENFELNIKNKKIKGIIKILGELDKSKFNLTNLSFNKKKENKINKIILKILKKQYKLIRQIYEKILTFEKTKIENNSEILFQQKRIKILKNSVKEQEYLEKALNKYKIEKNWKNKVFVEFAFMYAKNGLLRFGILEEITEEEFTLLADENLENDKRIYENKAEIYKKLTERELPFEQESAINNSALFTSIWNDGIELNLNIKMMKIIIKMAKNFKEYKELIIEKEENDEIILKKLKKFWKKLNGIF